MGGKKNQACVPRQTIKSSISSVSPFKIDQLFYFNAHLTLSFWRFSVEMRARRANPSFKSQKFMLVARYSLKKPPKSMLVGMLVIIDFHYKLAMLVGARSPKFHASYN